MSVPGFPTSGLGDLQDQLQGLWTAAFDAKLLDPTSEEFPVWRRLASFRPSADVQESLLARGARSAFFFQKLESAAGDTVNLDYLKLRIDQLPGGADGPGLLNTIRRRFDGCFRLPWYRFAYEIGFGPSSDVDGDAWASMNPNDALGAVMQFEIGLNGTGGLLIDRAAVLCSEITSTSWIFTTVSTDEAWGHPVSGNRTWWMEQKGGIWYFCCAGVDRATKFPDPLVAATVGFWFAERFVWLTMMNNVANWINSLGGAAELDRKLRIGPSWQDARRNLWKPNIGWLPESGP